MAEVRVDVSELKSEGSDLIEELSEFLREKMNAQVETVSEEILVREREKTVSKRHLRVLLRKFLHQNELRDYFRVIGGRENTLTVKERKIPEE